MDDRMVAVFFRCQSDAGSGKRSPTWMEPAHPSGGLATVSLRTGGVRGTLMSLNRVVIKLLSGALHRIRNGCGMDDAGLLAACLHTVGLAASALHRIRSGCVV